MKTKDGQDQRNRNDKSRRLGEPQKESRGFGNEQDKITNFDSQRANIYERNRSKRRRKITGGILSQLIEDSKDQLAACKRQQKYYAQQEEKWQKRLEYLESLNVLREEELD